MNRILMVLLILFAPFSQALADGDSDSSKSKNPAPRSGSAAADASKSDSASDDGGPDTPEPTGAESRKNSFIVTGIEGRAAGGGALEFGHDNGGLPPLDTDSRLSAGLRLRDRLNFRLGNRKSRVRATAYLGFDMYAGIGRRHGSRTEVGRDQLDVDVDVTGEPEVTITGEPDVTITGEPEVEVGTIDPMNPENSDVGVNLDNVDADVNLDNVDVNVDTSGIEVGDVNFGVNPIRESETNYGIDYDLNLRGGILLTQDGCAPGATVSYHNQGFLTVRDNRPASVGEEQNGSVRLGVACIDSDSFFEATIGPGYRFRDLPLDALGVEGADGVVNILYEANNGLFGIETELTDIFPGRDDADGDFRRVRIDGGWRPFADRGNPVVLSGYIQFSHRRVNLPDSDGEGTRSLDRGDLQAGVAAAASF